MTRITIDAALSSKLRTIDQPLEMCDEEGHLLGHFFPVPPCEELVGPQISDEELDRIEQSSVWYSTAGVLERLERL